MKAGSISLLSKTQSGTNHGLQSTRIINSKALDNVLNEADKWLKDIRDNYGVAIATADLASELGRLPLRSWLGEEYKKSKESDSK